MIAHIPPPPTEYLFIDAGYLRSRLTNWGKHFHEERLPFRFESLKQGFLKVFYFDSPPAQRDGEELTSFQERADEYENSKIELIETGGFHVREGSLKTRSGRKSEGRQEQKQVDVMLSVEMLAHAMRGNFSKATLLAGDLDFLPVVEALVQNGIYITIWAHKRTISKELWRAADRRREFRFAEAYSNCQPDFISRFGRVQGETFGAGELKGPTWKLMAKSCTCDWKIFGSTQGPLTVLVDLPETASGPVKCLSVTNSNNRCSLLKALAKEDHGVELSDIV